MALTKIKTGSIADNAITDAKVADDITAGAASTAATLATARNINGVSFNGSSAITVTAAAGTLTGNTLASGVTASSLTSVGTLTALTTGAITQNAGTFTIKNASSDSNGLKIYQDSGDASKIYNHYNGTLQLGVGSTTALTIDSSENATFEQDITVKGDYLTITNTAQCGLKMKTDDTMVIWNYDKTSDAITGGINWNHADGTTTFHTNGTTERMRITSDGKVGIGHTTPQFGLTLAQGDTDKEAIGWEDASNTKRASIYCGTSDDSLRFHVNGADRGRFETNGKFVAKHGIRFDGTELAGSDTGVSSSGHGGDLRFYVNGNQIYTLNSHTLKIDSGSNGSPAQLTCTNSGSTGWTGAAINLLYTGSSGNRGQGIYMHSEASDREWFAGTMYAVDNNRWSICYESRASFGVDTAEVAHEVFSVSTNGSIAVGTQGGSGNKTVTINGGTWDEPSINWYPYGNYQFRLKNTGTSSSKKFTLTNNASETIFETGGNNSKDMWFGGDVSAASFTDRTPYPETLKIAYDVLASHKKLDDYDKNDKEHQLDHTKLHDFAKPQITVSTGTPDKEKITKELGQDGRDASAVISCLVEVVNDLTAKVEALENA
jgi:hypothetical protein